MTKVKLVLYYWGLVILLFCISFLPWAFFDDVKENFTGFYSYGNHYGKPSILLLSLSILSGLLLFIDELWARLIALVLMGLCLAYAISTYMRYTFCYKGICPSPKVGLYLMITLVVALFLLSLYGKVKKKKNIL